MKVAALDLGTNSFLCLIAEIGSGGIIQILSDQVEIVRLGQDVNRTQAFHPDAIDRARACLQRFRQSIDVYKPDRILAMATSAARDVSNSDELFQLGRELNIPMEIIPGEREAEITFKGSTSGFPHDGRVRAVIDIGGGSTEIIAGRDGKPLGGDSINIGGLRLTERFFPSQPPEPQQIEKLKAHVQECARELIQKIRKLSPVELIAVGGNPTELASIMLGGFDANKIDGFKLSLSDIGEWRKKIEKTSPQQRVQQFHVTEGRADIILSGILILETILEMLSLSQVTVSTRGVRFGVALELMERG